GLVAGQVRRVHEEARVRARGSRRVGGPRGRRRKAQRAENPTHHERRCTPSPGPTSRSAACTGQASPPSGSDAGFASEVAEGSATTPTGAIRGTTGRIAVHRVSEKAVRPNGEQASLPLPIHGPNGVLALPLHPRMVMVPG